MNLKDSIEKIRKLIAHTKVVIRCKKENHFTKHQENLKIKLQKTYGSSKMKILETKLTVLQQELKSKTERLRYQKKLYERKIINRQFFNNPKKLYRSMKGEAIEIKNTPRKEEVEQFWKSIWQDKDDFKQDAEWLKTLEETYCTKATPKKYTITRLTLEKAIQKMSISKSPGHDKIAPYWFKHLTSYRDSLAHQFNIMVHNDQPLPKWFSTAHTVLIPKNQESHIAKNYRPIACLNIQYKLYTNCINTFLTDHVERNHVITQEQIAGKRGVWSTTEQLLINKNILKEVKTMRRNLYTVWLDYKKAFDSIPHKWLLHALKLAKVPDHLITAIKNLTDSWYTKLHLQGKDGTITTDLIKILKGVYQGDSLSVILFVLSLNPLSYMLQRAKGYAFGKNRQHHHTHNFFVDDLKLYTGDINTLKHQLNIVTKFSNDVTMRFGIDKCSYLHIKKGRIVDSNEPLSINGLKITPLKSGDHYKYLGIDENISYDGPINKERISKEYLSRVKKIWTSELSDYNKVTAHNTFATPVITPTVGILDWTIAEIEQLDIKTRKKLTLSGSFHPNSDIDKLYISRSKGGRGLKSIKTLFEGRIISIYQHLKLNSERNHVLDFVNEAEKESIKRVSEELLRNANIEIETREKPKTLSRRFNATKSYEHDEKYTRKVMHGFFQRKLKSDANIDLQTSLNRSKNKNITSHFVGYLDAIIDQEVPTRYLQHKRQVDQGLEPTVDKNCRLCRTAVEDVVHVISGCPGMSARYYLPLRHDALANYVLKEIIKKNHPHYNYQESREPEYVKKIENKEYWWNLPIKTITKVPHNKPDIIIWDKLKKVCTIIEVSCPSDVNISSKIQEKLNNYAALLRNMQILYRDYRFEFLPIIVGALGYMPKCLFKYMEDLGFQKNEAKKHIHMMQKIVTSGTVKICKTFLNF